jgi:hypothetical protein
VIVASKKFESTGEKQPMEEGRRAGREGNSPWRLGVADGEGCAVRDEQLLGDEQGTTRRRAGPVSRG